MPSSEDMIEAHNLIREWAVEQLKKEGHAEHSAKEIVKRMTYDEAVKYAEKIQGPIYRGAYSPFG